MRELEHTIGLHLDPVLPNGIKYVVAGHNKIRGTYGNRLLNAELLAAKGMLG